MPTPFDLEIETADDYEGNSFRVSHTTQVTDPTFLIMLKNGHRIVVSAALKRQAPPPTGRTCNPQETTTDGYHNRNPTAAVGYYNDISGYWSIDVSR